LGKRPDRGKPLVTVQIFVEGGGDAKTTLTKCRQGFADYCAKVAPPKHQPSIVACGGRQQAFDRFKNAILNRRAGETFVLLVDSEGPVTAHTAVDHLHTRDGWDFASLRNFEAFLMVQAMEAWFLADREILTSFYGDGFLAGRLPGSSKNIEAVPKDDLESKMIHASKPTKTKGQYHKTKHGFALLGLIDPIKVENGSRHAARFNQFLRSL
jgi:hypothetical protein